MYRIENNDFYPFYEITCSPLSPRAYDITDKPEFNNPLRIEGTLVMEQNFLKLNFEGDRKNRKLIAQIYTIDNELKWQQEIKKSELRHN